MHADDEMECGVACFSKVAASVSHEFKNHLATIREKAGLLSDMLAMQARGREVDPARLAAIAADIQQRTADADDVVKRLNAFAHSADHPVGEVSVEEYVRLAVGLFSRLAAQRSVTLSVTSFEDISLSTRPYALLQTLLACLDAVTLNAPEGATVTVEAVQNADGAAVRFSGGSGQDVPDIAPVLESLAASLVVESESTIVLRLPLAV